MDSTTPAPGRPPVPRAERCRDCGGRGTHRGHDVPVECQTCWSTGADPWVGRMAEIRRRVAADVLLQVEPESVIAMLRDLVAENDRLAEASFVRRAETLCEGAELLHKVGMPQAGELLEAQVLLEEFDHRGYPLGRDLYVRILAGLARHPEPAAAADGGGDGASPG